MAVAVAVAVAVERPAPHDRWRRLPRRFVGPISAAIPSSSRAKPNSNIESSSSACATWFRNVNLRVLPYLPWRDRVMAMTLRDIERAAKAHTLSAEPAVDYRPETANYGARSLR